MAIRCVVLSALFLATLAMAPNAFAQQTTYEGCFVCESGGTSYGSEWNSCRMVPNNSHGLGIYCTETEVFMSRYCSLSGGGCYYTETTGGGSGGDPGTGGGTGPRDRSGYCSPEYNSCY